MVVAVRDRQRVRAGVGMIRTHDRPADRLLPDALWQRLQPLLPPPPSRARGGAPRTVPDRACMAAIMFMARTSTPWTLLPTKELGCGSATTCWRRLDEWARAGVFDQLQAVLLDELGAAGRIDLDRVSVDSFSLRAVKGGDLTGANPTDRGKAGSKLHLAGERGGLPDSVVLSAANANDSTMLEAVLDDIPPIRMSTGRRRRRPGTVHTDKAYDHRRCRRYLRRRGIRPRIARRKIESSQRLGRHRWTIERTGAWLGGFRRLRIRYERSSERFYALVLLACSVICFRALASRRGDGRGCPGIAAALLRTDQARPFGCSETPTVDRACAT
jgi:transposase